MESRSDVPLISDSELPDRRGGGRIPELAKEVWGESKKLWVVAGPAAFTRLTFYGMTVVSQAFAGHIGDLELAAFSIATTVISGLSFGFFIHFTGWHGKCNGDALRPSLRCKAVPHDGHLPAALVAHPPQLRRAPYSDVHLQRAAAHRVGSARRAVAPGGRGQPVHAPSALRLRHHPAAQQVPAVPAQELGRRGHHGRGVPRARRRYLAAGALLPARGLWSRDGAHLVLGTRNGGPPLVCLRQRVPGDVEGILSFSVRGLEGLHQAVRGVWCHALVWHFFLLFCSLENWYYRILVFLTGYVKNAELAVDALSICISYAGWEMMIHLGFLAGTGVRVANELGAANGAGARFATIVSMTTSFLISLFISFLILIFHDKLGMIFSSSQAVIDAVDNISFLLALTILFNGIQPVLSGVAVGSGWQALVAYVNIGSYYLIGVPFGFLLGWGLHYGVQGIWVGMIVGTMVQTLILAYIILRCDWNEEALKASTRMRRWSNSN
ncbi:protein DETOXIFICATION 27-like isoform X1 [Miscanthus floridulus]|uniref:protein DETOXIFICATION 27-like isoform X1 n=1 Tax=Miscanthus floridulus TaxID=154761 RepID=UPI00345AFA72